MKQLSVYINRLAVLTLLFFETGNTWAQYEDSAFVRYTVKDGLSSNYILSLQQDELGYIWAGTTMGLNRFDGLRFKSFFRDEHIQLPSGSITRLRKFGSNKLGIFSKRGLYLLNTLDLSFHHYFISDSTPFSNYLNATWDALQFPDQSIAMTTAAGFYVLNQDGSLRFRHDAYTASDHDKSIRYGRDILRVTDRELLVYTQDYGLVYYDTRSKEYKDAGQAWSVFRMNPGSEANMHYIPAQISAQEYLFFYILRDSIGYFDYGKQRLVKSPLPFNVKDEINWESKFLELNDSLFAVSAGSAGFYIFLLDRNTCRIHFQSRKYLADHKINALYLDREKRLWVGTNNGLLRQRIHENFLKVSFYTPVPGDYTEVGFQSAFRYKDKLYLTRYSRTNGLVVVDTATGEIIKRITFYDRQNGWNEISSVIMYHPDTLWLGTTNGVLWLDLKTYRYGRVFDPVSYPFVPASTAFFSRVNRDGYAWFCFALEGCVVRYHVATRQYTFFTEKSQPALPFKKIKSIAYDAFGDIWIGGHSLTRWNTRKQEFDTVISVYAGAGKFNDDILALTADDKGSLWLHNGENGLLEYRIKDKKFIAYTMNDGLPSSVFQCLSPVVNDLLWIGCATNLTRFDIVSKKCFVYDFNDGFPDATPHSRRMYHDPETGHVYMFFTDAIVKFPARNIQRQAVAGDLLVQEVRVNNNKSLYHPGDTLRLRHNENTVELQYNMIEFESPNSFQFSYRLDNDKDWTIAGSQRTLSLNGLPAGKHTLLIKASGKNGEEKTKLFTILIGKPFWKTTAFLLGCALLLAGTGYYLYRRRLNAVHQKANIDKLIAQTQMKALHAQMNPHFVFNSLNSIREMILNNENKEASHFLSKFAHLMRMTLEHSAHSFISLRSTMDYLRRYMEMEQIRNDHFTCRMLADEELDPDDTLLPPMLIQPFIENAIWHGVSGGKKDININIDFKKEKEQLVCVIDDNGIGINQSMKNKPEGETVHLPVGISNIQNRIRLLNEKYGLQSSIEISDKSALSLPQPGTRVTIRLPLQIREE